MPEPRHARHHRLLPLKTELCATRKLTVNVKCPTCGVDVEWSPASKYRPFCSDRCRLIDLGEWFNEEHKISDGDTTTSANIAHVLTPEELALLDED